MNYKEATRMLGVTVSTVYRWIDSGKLKAVKDSNDEWVISRESVEEILNEENAKMKKHAETFALSATGREFKDYTNDQIDKEIEMIKAFSTHIAEAKDNKGVIESVEKLIARYENVKELQAASDIFNKKFRQQKKYQVKLEKE